MKRLLTLLLAFPALLLALAVSTPASAPSAEGLFVDAGVLSPATMYQSSSSGTYATPYTNRMRLVVPALPNGGTTDDYGVRITSSWDRQLTTAGQNLGIVPHAGLNPATNYVAMSVHWHTIGESGGVWHSAPVSIDNWGETLPAQGPIYAPEELTEAARRDPSAYAGPSGGNPEAPYDPGLRVQVAEFDQAYNWDPGDVLEGIYSAHVFTPDWDQEGHPWPFYWQSPYTYSLQFEWVPIAGN